MLMLMHIRGACSVAALCSELVFVSPSSLKTVLPAGLCRSRNCALTSCLTVHGVSTLSTLLVLLPVLA